MDHVKISVSVRADLLAEACARYPYAKRSHVIAYALDALIAHDDAGQCYECGGTIQHDCTCAELADSPAGRIMAHAAAYAG